MPLPYPHVFLPDVTHITPELLQKLGVSALLLDIDGTLMQTRDAMPRQAVLDWMKAMQSDGFTLYILSNNKSPARTESYARRIGCDWRHKSKKPSTKGFLAAAEHLGLQPHELAIVGDQIYTDVLGGLRSGMWTLMVQSTDTYLWYFPLRRLVELPFRFERRAK